MTLEGTLPFLPAILGGLCQARVTGELRVEQEGHTCRLFWHEGQLLHVQSDGEPTTPARCLRQALDRPVLSLDWQEAPVPAPTGPSGHRSLVWEAFREARSLDRVHALLATHADWRWQGESTLLDGLADLPLTPRMAYACSFLVGSGIRFPEFGPLCGLDDQEAGRLLVTLWALGSLYLSEGAIPAPWMTHASDLEPEPEPEPEDVKIEIEEILGPETPDPLPVVPAMRHSQVKVTQDAAPREALQPPTPRIALQPPTPPRIAPACSAPTAPIPRLSVASLMARTRRLLQQDRTGEAIRLLEQSVQMDPDSPGAYEPWLLLGKLRTTNPAWTARAIEALQAACRVKPKAPEPWALMGEIYFRKGFRANAHECYLKARSLDPETDVPQEIFAPDYLPRPEEEGLLHRLKTFLKF